MPVPVSSESITMAGLMPHAPVLIPRIAGERLDQVINSIVAMRELSRRLMRSKPDRVLMISPHSPRRGRAFGLWVDDKPTGSFARFGFADIHCSVPNDFTFLKRLRLVGDELRIPFWDITATPLDHGVLVPLHFLIEAGWHGPTFIVGLNAPLGGGLDDLGECIARAAKECSGTSAIVASGDMSHRLQVGAPAGFHARAHEFDHDFIELLRRGAYKNLAEINLELRELAAEDAVDSTFVALRAVNFRSEGREVLNYERPFGVGYGVAILFQHEQAGDQDTAGPQTNPISTPDLEALGGALVAAARQAVEDHLNGLIPDPGFAHSELLQQRRGVFVTIRNRQGELRGCRGNVHPQHPTLLDEVHAMALSSAFKDSRFDFLRAEELPDLVFEVSVVYPLEDVSSTLDLNPFVYGVVVRTEDGRRGIMLPNVEGLDTVEKQLEATRRKAYIHPGEPVILQRFRVDKFRESI